MTTSQIRRQTWDLDPGAARGANSAPGRTCLPTTKESVAAYVALGHHHRPFSRLLSYFKPF
jgi:hypothetical protein